VGGVYWGLPATALEEEATKQHDAGSVFNKDEDKGVLSELSRGIRFNKEAVEEGGRGHRDEEEGVPEWF
jgi:hypothetical protein